MMSTLGSSSTSSGARLSSGRLHSHFVAVVLLRLPRAKSSINSDVGTDQIHSTVEQRARANNNFATIPYSSYPLIINPPKQPCLITNTISRALTPVPPRPFLWKLVRSRREGKKYRKHKMCSSHLKKMLAFHLLHICSVLTTFSLT